MTDAELIDYLKDSHKFTSSRTVRVALDCAADRLAQLSEDNERLRQALRPFAEVTILPTGAVVGLERHWFDCASAAIAHGQKEGD